jgi:hypothetical protein
LIVIEEDGMLADIIQFILTELEFAGNDLAAGCMAVTEIRVGRKVILRRHKHSPPPLLEDSLPPGEAPLYFPTLL